MVNEDIKNRVRILYKSIKKASDSQRETEKNIKLLAGLKYDLDNAGTIDIDELDEIYLEGNIFEGITKKNIKEANKEMSFQIEFIAQGLGIDLEEETISKKSSEPPMFNINVSQNQSQSQYQSQSNNVNYLFKQLEEELEKPNPDKSKIRNLAEKILDLGIDYGPKLVKLILNFIT